MSNEFQFIREVSPGTTGWIVKVVVAEKFSPRIAQKSPTKYQHLILMDSELQGSHWIHWWSHVKPSVLKFSSMVVTGHTGGAIRGRTLVVQCNVLETPLSAEVAPRSHNALYDQDWLKSEPPLTIVVPLLKLGNVGNRAMAAVGKGCPLLMDSAISDCPQITDVGLDFIAKRCTLLESCDSFTALASHKLELQP
ncbi:F-box domain-containing protein [Forsythia ovata]|uniref:F-box domain-containing protein n=1 Tax=Forsythia ovata TaxID=205694 RepID=A0ABD1UT59_9LAMI